MENNYGGGVNPYDAATLALFSGGGCGGGIGVGNRGGNLCCGNEVLAADAHANGTATKEAIDAVGREAGANLDRVTAQNLEARTNDRFNGVNQNITNQEFRSLDRLRDIERDIVQNAKDAAKCCCEAQIEALKCCCETQKLVTAEATATRELINQNTIRAAVDTNNINATVGAINTAAAANTAAIVAAIQSSCRPWHPPV